MARPLEFVGSNVEKAATAASKKLNIPREALKYKVISYGSTGIFGLVGTKKAKIQVHLSAEKEGARKKSKVDIIKEKLGVKSAPEPPKPQAPKPEAPKKDNTTKEMPEKVPEKKESPSKAGTVVGGDAPEVSVDLKRIGLELLERITALIAEDAKIEIDENPDRLLYKIESSDAAVLIGKRGQTLEAIQYLVEKVINKNSDKRIHAQVDVEGYLEKREESLRDLSTRMAEKAVRTRKPVTIGQMSAYERRIVHLALKNDNRVRTQSRGDGFLRKLLIFPVKKGNNKKKTQGGNTQ